MKILFVYNKLSANEKKILEILVHKSRILEYDLIDISTQDVSLNEIENSVLLLIYNNTKAKPSVIKVLELKFGKEFLKDHARKYVISTPSRFMLTIESRDEVWDLLQKIIKTHATKTIDVHSIFSSGKGRLTEILKEMEQNKRHILELNNGQILEIRPVNSLPSNSNSITFDEFAVLILAKSLFNITNFKIESIDNE